MGECVVNLNPSIAESFLLALPRFRFETCDRVSHLFLKIIPSSSYSSSSTVCLNYSHPPTFCFHKTKHVHTLAEKFPSLLVLFFQGLVEQREKAPEEYHGDVRWNFNQEEMGRHNRASF